MAEAKERVEHNEIVRATVQANALDRQFDRKGGGMRAVRVAIPNCLVRDEPVVAAAALVLPVSVPPAGDVGFVGIGHANG